VARIEAQPASPGWEPDPG